MQIVHVTLIFEIDEYEFSYLYLTEVDIEEDNDAGDVNDINNKKAPSKNGAEYGKEKYLDTEENVELEAGKDSGDDIQYSFSESTEANMEATCSRNDECNVVSFETVGISHKSVVEQDDPNLNALGAPPPSHMTLHQA